MLTVQDALQERPYEERNRITDAGHSVWPTGGNASRGDKRKGLKMVKKEREEVKGGQKLLSALKLCFNGIPWQFDQPGK